jgi:hypothetical protein
MLLAAAFALGPSACSLAADFSGYVLVSDAGSTSDASGGADGTTTNPTEAGADSSTTSNDGSMSGNTTDGSMSGDDAGDGSIISGPCAIHTVQAVPGTTVEQVIQQMPSLQQTLTTTAGNLLVAIAYGGQGPGKTTPPTTAPNMTFAVVDDTGDTFYAGDMVENPIEHQSALQIFFAPNVKGGVTTVTVTSTTGGGAFTLWTGLLLQEYSGIATANVATAAAARSANMSTASPSAGNMTTPSACDLVVGAFVDGHVSEQGVTPLPGWITRSTDVWDPGGVVDNAGSPAAAQSTVNPGMTLANGADNGWVAAQIAFRGANVPAPAAPTGLGFATSPQTVLKGACSSAVTIATKGLSTSSGIVATNGITIALSGAGLTFYADPGCAFPITSTRIGAGSSAHSFYVSGATAGPATITATPSGALTQPITQSVTIN